MRSVCFSLLIAADSDVSGIKSRLESIAEEMKGAMLFEEAQCLPYQGLKFMPCQTMQHIYEMMFCTLLEYDTKEGKWMQAQPAVIPTEFKGQIMYVELQRNS